MSTLTGVDFAGLFKMSCFYIWTHIGVQQRPGMVWRSILVLFVLAGMRESPIPVAASVLPESGQESTLHADDNAMASGELNPNHYPARRAAKVVQHYLNAHYGSPYRLFGLNEVYSGKAEDVLNSGRHYHLEISVQDIINNKAQKCSAEVLFPQGAGSLTPKVNVSSCGELLHVNTKPQEETFYREYKNDKVLPETHNIPDNFGNIEPDMIPFWHLTIAASSFIMLEESTENTLYNMAQVASIKQLPTENNQLKFECFVLLHEMVSQEIIQWKFSFTWSSAQGIHVLQKKQVPRKLEEAAT